MVWWHFLWPGKRRRKSAPIVLVFYTRKNCCLCDAAWESIEKAGESYYLNVKKVDVDADPVLAELYGLEVPVVEVNGQIRFRGQVNPVLLRRLLHAERDRAMRPARQ